MADGAKELWTKSRRWPERPEERFRLSARRAVVEFIELNNLEGRRGGGVEQQKQQADKNGNAINFSLAPRPLKL